MPTLSLAIDARKAKLGAAEFNQATRTVKGGAAEATASTIAANKAITRLGATCAAVRTTIGGLWAKMGGALALIQTVRTLSNFEQAIATIASTGHRTAEEMDALRVATKELGATTRFTASQAAEAALALARGGYETGVIIGTLEHVLNLASGGMLELGEAADILSTALGQYKLGVGDAAHATDVLVGVANSARTDVRQFAEALVYAGPVANAAGISLEETAAAIGVLADAGIKGSMAGTTLRGSISSIVGPTGDAKRVLEAAGISSGALTIQAEGLAGVFQRLKDSGVDVTKAFEAFDTRQAAGAITMIGSTDRMRELTAQAEAYKDVASETARVQEDNLKGSFLSLSSAIEALQLAAGDAGFTGVLRTIVDTTTGAVRILAGMEDKVTKNRRAAQLLADAIQAVAVVFATMMALKVAGWFVGTARAIYTAVTATKVLTATLMANPFGLIAVAIAAAVAALYHYRDATIEIGDKTLSVGALVEATWEHLTGKLDFLWRVVRRGSELAWTGVVEVSGWAWDTVGQHVATALNVLGLNWRTVFEGLLGVTKDFANVVIGLFVGIQRTIGSILSALAREVKLVGSTIATLVNPLASAIEKANALKNAAFGSAMNLGNLAGNVAGPMAGALAEDYVGNLVTAAEKHIPLISAAAGAALDQIMWKGFSEELEKYMVPGADIDSIFRRAQEIYEANRAAVPAGTAAAGDDSLKILKEILEKDAAKKAIQETTEAAKRLKEVGDDIGSSFSNTFEDILLDAKSFADAMKSLVSDILRTIYQATAGKFISENVSSLVQDILPALGKGAADASTTSAAPKYLGDVFGAQQNALGNVFSGTSYFWGNGRLNSLGERGPEAVMPLTRVPGTQELGVKTTGGGGGGTVVNINQNIRTPNVDSFRRGNRHMVADAKRAFSRRG